MQRQERVEHASEPPTNGAPRPEEETMTPSEGDEAFVARTSRPVERRWVFVDTSGRAYQLTVRPPGAGAFDTMDAEEAEGALARWVEDTFAPWGSRGPTLVAALEEVCAAITGAPQDSEAQGGPWEERVARARGALERALRGGRLRCERIRRGVARPELLDDLPPTLRAPPSGLEAAPRAASAAIDEGAPNSRNDSGAPADPSPSQPPSPAPEPAHEGHGATSHARPPSPPRGDR